MKHTTKLFAVCLVAVIGFAVPAFAQGQSNLTREERAQAREVRREARLNEQEVKKEAREKAKEIRAQARAERSELKPDKCERNQAKIERAIPRISRNAENLVGVFDKIYDRVQGFYESGQLTVSNYDELADAVDEAQLAATTDVAALQELEFTLDCDDPETGVELVSLKDIATGTKDSIKSYRSALVDLISAMRSAAAEASEDSETTTDDESSEDTTEEDNSADDSGTNDESSSDEEETNAQ